MIKPERSRRGFTLIEWFAIGTRGNGDRQHGATNSIMAHDDTRLDSIFCGAIEIATSEERAAFIAGACGSDEELRRRVERLLDAHIQAGNFLVSPRASATPTVGSAPSTEDAGAEIGPYRLLQAIGEGGMGTVFMAEQTRPVRRTVALKIIKAGMDSRQVLARFSAERQALALMDDPNIAKVLDAGTTDSRRPYFVMELVKGIPITQFCDKSRLTLRERLELFWDIMRDEAIPVPGENATATSAAWSPDGKRLAIGRKSGEVEVFEYARWKRVARIAHRGTIRAVTFNKDGRYLGSPAKSYASGIAKRADLSPPSWSIHNRWTY